ncbi:MAG: T9SS type A sorting domain-containing protein [Flavobacteriales bacterium]|nr:T9SS type A sorting domain-containing protein [Flavobacteriales bacterium]
MVRTLTLSCLFALPTLLNAASGGPDQYGYIWKDSNEPGGPVYNWIDITQTGTLVTGLADDNVVGPVVLATNAPYYWYDIKKVWIGSNGYLVFNNSNIAAPFPFIPTAGATNDYVAGFMTDLSFAGAGNPGQCYLYDDLDSLVVSYINVPFWSVTAPGWTGSNTFQIIMNKQDSTITVQYQAQSGISSSNGPICGIESLTGDIGLMATNGSYPAPGYAIRFYNPAVPLLDVTDAAVEWLTAEGSRGLTLQRNGAPTTLTTFVRNTGNQPLGLVKVRANVFRDFQLLLEDSLTVGPLGPGVAATLTFPNTFTATQGGTHRYVVSIDPVPNELVASNNTFTQELVAYDTTLLALTAQWAGPSDDGIGIGWNGGDGGVGMHILPPYYPCYISGTTIRINSNAGLAGYTMKVYDDDGPNGGPGTLLDSVFVTGAQGTPGDHVHPLANPFVLNDGTLWVEWYMQGQNVNIAQDVVAPASLRAYEVLGGVWAEYRDQDIADFHLGLRIEQLPVFDAGCTGFFGLVDGLQVSQPVNVRTWVKNFGNQPITGFPVSYRFANEPAVTQNYTGAPIPPGDSVLFLFNTPFLPETTASGAFCAWTGWPNDSDAQNDTACVSIDVIAGLAERALPSLVLQPNPAADQAVLEGLDGTATELAVFDLAGHRVQGQAVAPGAQRLVLDVRTLAAGTYQVLVTTPKGVRHGKLVVVR